MAIDIEITELQSRNFAMRHRREQTQTSRRKVDAFDDAQPAAFGGGVQHSTQQVVSKIRREDPPAALDGVDRVANRDNGLCRSFGEKNARIVERLADENACALHRYAFQLEHNITGSREMRAERRASRGLLIACAELLNRNTLCML